MTWRDWIAFRPAHRAQVLAAVKNLPAIPEADRMRTRPVVVKPKTVTQWKRLNDRRTA